MRPPLIQQARQGNGSIADEYLRIHRQRQRERQTLDKLIAQLPHLPDQPTSNRAGHRSGEGDRQRLRAIPVICQAIGGTIPGTDPLAALLDKERRNAA